MINPQSFKAKAVFLIRQTCPIDRDCCPITPSRWYQTQYPENFAGLLWHWEEAGKELLDG